MHNTVKYLEHEYKKKSNHLDMDFNNRKRELEEEFEDETHTFIDPKQQLEHEEREKAWDLDM